MNPSPFSLTDMKRILYVFEYFLSFWIVPFMWRFYMVTNNRILLWTYITVFILRIFFRKYNIIEIEIYMNWCFYNVCTVLYYNFCYTLVKLIHLMFCFVFCFYSWQRNCCYYLDYSYLKLTTDSFCDIE